MRRFRPEIEGLRAVAALLVAIYHIFLGRVSGGVDVFFTVAGFLITLTLLRQVHRHGAVSAAVFFSRLAKRLLPAALLVLTVVAVGTATLLPASRRSATFGEIIASVLYVENWALAGKAVDYLARDEGVSPVQHFWAMAIQGQFYIIWFVAFLAALAFGASRITVTLRWIFGALFVGSLGFSVYLTAVDQPLAYFHTGTRVWEFAAGGLMALFVTKIDRIPVRIARPLGWLGLGLIVACGLVLQVSELFPGWVALWPVLGALMVIASGVASGRGSVVSLLGSSALVTVGGMSYAIYLWHWPLLVFYLAITGHTMAPVVPGLLIIVATVVLAYLTTRFVEKPFRAATSGRAVKRGQAVALAATAALLVGIGSVGARPPVVDVPVVAGATSPQHPGPAAVAEGWDGLQVEFDEPPIPDLAVAKRDRSVVYELGCHVGTRASEFESCSFGDPDGDVTVMLLGGSHSAHWQPGLEIVAEDRGWHLISGTKGACHFSTQPTASANAMQSCLDWNAAALAEVERIRPDYVFTTATLSWRLPTETVPEGYLERWAELAELGVEVLAVRDTPRSAVNQVECLEANRGAPERCGVERSEFYAEIDPAQTLDPPPAGVTFLDLSHLLCGPERCPAIVGNVVVYHDHSHMTATWSRALAPFLDEIIPSAERA